MKPDEIAFLVLWLWIGFSATFTIVIWARLASLQQKYFGVRVRKSWPLFIIVVRIVFSILAVGGVLATVRLWALRIIDPAGLSVVMWCLGAFAALLLAYCYRSYLFREE